MKILSLLLAILMFGQSLLPGAELFCCDTETSAAVALDRCHHEQETDVLDFPMEGEQEHEDEQHQCFCPNCLTHTPSLLENFNFSVSIPILQTVVIAFWKSSYRHDYASILWQPPQLG